MSDKTAPEAKIEKVEIPANDVEAPKIPEKKIEEKRIEQPEKPRVSVETKADGGGSETPAQVIPQDIIGGTTTQSEFKDREKRIEKVLEEGLGEMYVTLTPDQKKQFKVVGEQTAKQINQLLNETKVKIGKIVELIKKWLSLIPGVNRFFLEQEAKIKADEIIQLNKKT